LSGEIARTMTGLNGSEETRLILQISNTAAEMNSCILAGRNSPNKISGIIELFANKQEQNECI
jgi:hypothetical protein